MTERRWQDFSEMPDDELRAFANDLANPREALQRIRARKSGVDRKRDARSSPEQ